jgi:hypothetical protein
MNPKHLDPRAHARFLIEHEPQRFQAVVIRHLAS